MAKRFAERVQDLFDSIMDNNLEDGDALEEIIIQALKLQDAATRHACAESVIRYPLAGNAHDACMNERGGVK